jgi:hypothetical protein
MLSPPLLRAAQHAAPSSLQRAGSSSSSRFSCSHAECSFGRDWSIPSSASPPPSLLIAEPICGPTLAAAFAAALAAARRAHLDLVWWYRNCPIMLQTFVPSKNIFSRSASRSFVRRSCGTLMPSGVGPSGVGNRGNATIDADIAVAIFRAKLCARRRDGTAAGLAEAHGITQKAVREIWNLKTWAEVTSPYWTTKDRELWARSRKPRSGDPALKGQRCLISGGRSKAQASCKTPGRSSAQQKLKTSCRERWEQNWEICVDSTHDLVAEGYDLDVRTLPPKGSSREEVRAWLQSVVKLDKAAWEGLTRSGGLPSAKSLFMNFEPMTNIKSTDRATGASKPPTAVTVSHLEQVKPAEIEDPKARLSYILYLLRTDARKKEYDASFGTRKRASDGEGSERGRKAARQSQAPKETGHDEQENQSTGLHLLVSVAAKLEDDSKGPQGSALGCLPCSMYQRSKQDADVAEIHERERSAAEEAAAAAATTSGEEGSATP